MIPLGKALAGGSPFRLPAFFFPASTILTLTFTSERKHEPGRNLNWHIEEEMKHPTPLLSLVSKGTCCSKQKLACLNWGF
jgi:hypothetical protein